MSTADTLKKIDELNAKIDKAKSEQQRMAYADQVIALVKTLPEAEQSKYASAEIAKYRKH